MVRRARSFNCRIRLQELPLWFVHRLLGKIKITEQADQSCQDSPRIHAIKGVEQFAYLVMYRLGGRLGHDTLGHEDDLNKPAPPNQFGKPRIEAGRSRQSAQVVTLKYGQQNASSLESSRLTQNRRCTHLSFVQAQHYRVALESRAIRKSNHKSETVRVRLRGLEAFMRWVAGYFRNFNFFLTSRLIELIDLG